MKYFVALNCNGTYFVTDGPFNTKEEALEACNGPAEVLHLTEETGMKAMVW